MKLEDVKKPEMYSAKEIADRMGVSLWAFYRLVRAGKIKGINISVSETRPQYRFRPEDLQEYYDNLATDPERTRHAKQDPSVVSGK